MSRVWNYKKLECFAEVQEAALKVTILLCELQTYAKEVLSSSESWSPPVRAIQRLQIAIKRSDELSNKVLSLIASLILKIEFKEGGDSILTEPKSQRSGGSGFRYIISMKDEIDGLLKLLQQAKGLCAAFDVANSEIDDYLEPIIAEDDLNHDYENELEEVDFDAGIPATDDINSLFVPVLELCAACGRADREVRELIVALREVKTSEAIVTSNRPEK